jgi:hypothetical protein
MQFLCLKSGVRCIFYEYVFPDHLWGEVALRAHPHRKRLRRQSALRVLIIDVSHVIDGHARAQIYL